MELSRLRIAATTALIAIAIASASLIAGFDRALSISIGRATWVFTLHATVVLALVAATLGAFGAHAIVSSHPRARRGDLSHTAHYWMPAAIGSAVAALGILRLESPDSFIAALVGTGLFLATLLSLEYLTVDGSHPMYAQARWVLSVLDYAIAVGTFLLIASSSAQPTPKAIFFGVAALLLAIDLLRRPVRTPDVVALFEIAIGAIVGFAALEFTRLALSPLKSALLLLLILYVLAGALQQYFASRLTWWARIEYAALLILGGWVLLRFVP